LIGTAQVAVHGNKKEIEEDDDEPQETNVDKSVPDSTAAVVEAKEGHSVAMLVPDTIEVSAWSVAPADTVAAASSHASDAS
jgi:hypothetical protein